MGLCAIIHIISRGVPEGIRLVSLLYVWATKNINNIRITRATTISEKEHFDARTLIKNILSQHKRYHVREPQPLVLWARERITRLLETLAKTSVFS